MGKLYELILYASFAFLNEAVILLVTSTTTTQEAWDRLSCLYAKRSTTHIIHLKDKLFMTTRGSQSVTKFFISIKQIVDELTAVSAPSCDANLLVYTTYGLGLAHKELIIATRTRHSVVSFEELFDKIIDHKTFLLHNDKQNPESTPPTTHLAKHSLSSVPPDHYLPHLILVSFPILLSSINNINPQILLTPSDEIL